MNIGFKFSIVYVCRQKLNQIRHRVPRKFRKSDRVDHLTDWSVKAYRISGGPLMNANRR
jgi:hypothetical protein